MVSRSNSSKDDRTACLGGLQSSSPQQRIWDIAQHGCPVRLYAGASAKVSQFGLYGSLCGAYPLRSAPPNPPGYLPQASAKDLSKVSLNCPEVASEQDRWPSCQAHVFCQTPVAAKSDAEVARRARQSTELRVRRAWELALSPAKALPMQAIMLYFSGSGIQIFSLGTIFMLLTSPFAAVLNIFNGQSCSSSLGSARGRW